MRTNPCVIALTGRLLSEIRTFEPLSRYEVTEVQPKVVADRVYGQHGPLSALSPQGFRSQAEVMELHTKACRGD